MIGGLLLLIGAVYGILQSRKENEARKDWVTDQHIDDVVGTEAQWEQPVLDGRGDENSSPLASELERFLVGMKPCCNNTLTLMDP